MKPPRIELLTFEGCPHAAAALSMVREAAGRLAPGGAVEEIRVGSDEEARRIGFLGSPSIRVDGVDIEGRSGGACGLSCRVYDSADGLPPEWMVEAALLRAIRP
ncbi:MAG: hypothetical protein FJW35_14280, partial [Acidobacteria bacterium]|nr:hypothetical protein [Acidobacteriota bacterium]